MNCVSSLKSTTMIKNSFSFKKLLINKPTYAMYSAENYDTSTQILVESTGNGRNATCIGITKGVTNMNGASATISYLGGTSTSSIKFASGTIPSSYTICGLTRYVGTKNGRIFQSVEQNWLLGHWKNNIGMHFNGSWRTSQSSVGINTNWLNICGTNGNNSVPLNILSNGVGVGTASGGGNGVSTLTINGGLLYPGEVSDFEFSQLLIWNIVLTESEIKIVSNALANYAKYGFLDS
jgi:hypothetical protein